MPIAPIAIEDELKKSYLDYAMSVIVSRALPDARDGLKPVHRRILFSMHENGRDWNKPYRKSALIVGDVMGKYHPHGDQSIYDALVRMAQDFSMRVPLIDGQGNFGSVDGDPPAADALHRSAPRQGRPCADRGYRQGHGRVPGQLRRQRARAGGAAGALSQCAGQWLVRHRGRHGDQHPAPQSGRSDRRLPGLYRRSVHQPGSADRDRAGPGLPHRRLDHRQAGGARARWRGAAARS